MDEQEPLLTAAELAAKLKVSTKQVYRLVKAGQIKSFRVGRTHRFRLSDVVAELDSAEVAS